jgi:hypothetical protein
VLSGCIGPGGARLAGKPEPLAVAVPEPVSVTSVTELAARPEPRSTTEVAEIEAELDLIARRRAAGASPRERAAMEARAKELQRLVAAEGAASLRR